MEQKKHKLKYSKYSILREIRNRNKQLCRPLIRRTNYEKYKLLVYRLLMDRLKTYIVNSAAE